MWKILFGCAGLAAIIFFLNSDVYAGVDRYQLLHDKSRLEFCQRQARQRHSGDIELQHILYRSDKFWVRFEIRDVAGSEWSVLCDLETGGIVRDLNLFDGAFK